jgi:hypothetical protein
MTEVVKFYPKDAAKSPDNVLEQAIGVYKNVFIVGYDEDGDIDARASLGLTHSDVLWLIESFKAQLLAGEFSE